LLQGRKIDEFSIDGINKIDLIIKADEKELASPESIYRAQIASREGDLIRFEQLAEIKRTTGISEIRHVDGKRTITLQVTPPEKFSIQEGIELLQNEILPDLRAQGKLDNVDIQLRGTSDKLLQTIASMKLNLILAILITYLLMSALFANFIYPLIILVTLPLAAAGGFIGLALTNHYLVLQPLDVLTMLGFVILIGIVVNNAILIVHQTLNNKKQGLDYEQAIIDATKSRLRPIFMSSLTSVFGMLPLVLIPGPGSEFYRGLGSVITGGLALSTIFTIFIIPSLLMFVMKAEHSIGRRMSKNK